MGSEDLVLLHPWHTTESSPQSWDAVLRGKDPSLSKGKLKEQRILEQDTPTSMRLIPGGRCTEVIRNLNPTFEDWLFMSRVVDERASEFSVDGHGERLLGKEKIQGRKSWSREDQVAWEMKNYAPEEAGTLCG